MTRKRYGPGKHPRSKPGMPYWTQERVEKLRQLRRAGATLRALGEQYGLSYERIRQILRKKFDKKPIQVWLDDGITLEDFAKSLPKTNRKFYDPDIIVTMVDPDDDPSMVMSMPYDYKQFGSKP